MTCIICFVMSIFFFMTLDGVTSFPCINLYEKHINACFLFKVVGAGFLHVITNQIKSNQIYLQISNNTVFLASYNTQK